MEDPQTMGLSWNDHPSVSWHKAMVPDSRITVVLSDSPANEPANTSAAVESDSGMVSTGLEKQHMNPHGHCVHLRF